MGIFCLIWKRFFKYCIVFLIISGVNLLSLSTEHNRALSGITKKDDLTKENTRIKQVLKDNGYQKNVSKVFKRIISHNLAQS